MASRNYEQEQEQEQEQDSPNIRTEPPFLKDLGRRVGRLSKEQYSPSHMKCPVGVNEFCSSSDVTDIFKVRCTWNGSESNHLSIRQGQLVSILEKEKNWWRGESDGKVGWFPSEFVQQITNQEPSHPYLALYDYQAQRSGDLSFPESSMINVTETDGDWWTGELDGNTGVFPSNYVSPLVNYVNLSSDTTPEIIGRVIFDFSPEQEGDISIRLGQLVYVEKQEGKWCYGQTVLQSKTKPNELGWFPVDYIELLPSASYLAPCINPTEDSSDEKNRLDAIRELVETEKTYVNTLNDVKKVFFDPMNDQNILTQKERDQIICNWEELIQCNSVFRDALVEKLDSNSSGSVPNLGDLLQHHIPQLAPHVDWCSLAGNAIFLLETLSTTEFKEFELKCMKESSNGLKLSFLLMTPMQRVTRYPLLIEQILKYTSSTDVEYEPLQKALREAKTLHLQVNEAVCNEENIVKLEWLQKHVQLSLDERLVFNSTTKFMGQRILLHSGELEKRNKQIYGFLFNDFFILVKPRRRGKIELFSVSSDAEFTMCKNNREPFMLNQVRADIDPVKQYGDSTFKLIITKECKREEIQLKAMSNLERDNWVKKINDASVNNGRMERQNSKSAISKHAKSNLTVTVVEAADLVVTPSNTFCVVNVVEVEKKQERVTPIIKNTSTPHWNFEMKFFVSDANNTILEFNVYTSNLFSPDGFLGYAELSLKKLREERCHTSLWRKRLPLEHVATGVLQLIIAYD